MTQLVPPGAKPRSVGVRFGLLRVLHASAGRGYNRRLPVLLIHGGGSDNAGISWFRLMKPLSRDRSVWALDLPGFGGSIDAAPVGGPDALAAVAVDVLDQLGIGRAIVFGVSMGGDVALNLALHYSERVAGLVLVAPGGLVPAGAGDADGLDVSHFMAWLSAQTPDWLLLPIIRLANRFTTAAMTAMVDDPSSLPPEVTAEFVREARQARAGIAYARYNQATLRRHGMRNDMSGQVHNIAVPTLFFHGAEDRLVPPEASRRAASHMAQSRMVLVPHCGHWAQLEAHDRFMAEVGGFLAGFDQNYD